MRRSILAAATRGAIRFAELDSKHPGEVCRVSGRILRGGQDIFLAPQRVRRPAKRVRYELAVAARGVLEFAASLAFVARLALAFWSWADSRFARAMARRQRKSSPRTWRTRWRCGIVAIGRGPSGILRRNSTLSAASSDDNPAGARFGEYEETMWLSRNGLGGAIPIWKLWDENLCGVYRCLRMVVILLGLRGRQIVSL